MKFNSISLLKSFKVLWRVHSWFSRSVCETNEMNFIFWSDKRVEGTIQNILNILIIFSHRWIINSWWPYILLVNLFLLIVYFIKVLDGIYSWNTSKHDNQRLDIVWYIAINPLSPVILIHSLKQSFQWKIYVSVSSSHCEVTQLGAEMIKAVLPRRLHKLLSRFVWRIIVFTDFTDRKKILILIVFLLSFL